MNDVQAASWLLLITNLPGRNPTLRMRLWRALKATGAGPLRDGVYVLPISENSRRAFEEQATEIKGAGGAAHIVSFEANSPQQQATFMAFFDRTVRSPTPRQPSMPASHPMSYIRQRVRSGTAMPRHIGAVPGPHASTFG